VGSMPYVISHHEVRTPLYFADIKCSSSKSLPPSLFLALVFFFPLWTLEIICYKQVRPNMQESMVFLKKLCNHQQDGNSSLIPPDSPAVCELIVLLLSWLIGCSVILREHYRCACFILLTLELSLSFHYFFHFWWW